MPESPDTNPMSIMTSPPIMNSSGSHKSSSGMNGTSLSPRSHCSSDSPSPPTLSSTSGAGQLGSGNGPTTNGNSNSNPGLTQSMNGNGNRSRDIQATTCGTRQLSKVKRFLTTLQQFGSDISAEAGERVRNLILNLVNGTLTIDEFHQKLQETTNFPLRPFVIPFLKANLPLLQREILHCARLAKQSPQQYLHQHEHLVLDSAHSPTEPNELFHHSNELNENGKRRADSRHKENGNVDCGLELGPPAKRHHLLMSPPLVHPGSSSSIGLHSSLPLRLDEYAMPREFRERERLNLDREYRHYGYTTPRDILDERETEEEWKNIHTMLNCILGMVEKTKRALAILQHRSQTDRQELAMWVRRHAEGTENNLKKHAGDMMAQTLKTTEDRVSEVKRRAEEAVNEVKRQAVVELQKAVASAEVKARELVATERGKMEKLILEARRQATEEAISNVNLQADSNETCWNCGRKASETCSGCNIARYCGAFCQHKDWENHHHICGQNPATSTSTTANTVVSTVGANKNTPASAQAVTSSSTSTMPSAVSLVGSVTRSTSGATAASSSSSTNTTVTSFPRMSTSHLAVSGETKAGLDAKH